MKRKVIIGMAVLLLAACGRNGRLEQALEFAGENRPELEKVLEHYRDSGLKYKAACYLIEHMPRYYSYQGDALDSLRALQAGIFRDKHLSAEAKQAYGKLPHYSSLPKVYDAHVITADYLIGNIDLAFGAWEARPWKDELTFDEFCEWILPYRIADEPLENWRRVYRERFGGLAHALARQTDVVGVADSILKTVAQGSGNHYSVDLQLPHLGGLFLLEHCVGYCRETCDLSVYALRAVGIPCATDMLPAAPEAQHGHSWNVLKDSTGVVYFDYPNVVRGYDDRRKRGKVYRYHFAAPHLRDVTREYFGSNVAAVDVELPEGTTAADLHLSVFSSAKWMAVDGMAYEDGRATARDIEPGVFFAPTVSVQGREEAVGFAFRLVDGQVVYFHPQEQTERVELLRKYPLRKWTRIHLEEIAGSRFEASNTADFREAEVLYLIADPPTINYNAVPCHPTRAYRYVRYRAAEDKKGRLAELMLYRNGHDTVPLPMKVMEASMPERNDQTFSGTKIHDGDYLTFFTSHEKGAHVTVDLGRAERIERLVYVPRNDENFISRGHRYELFYQNGAAGWVSLGEQTATEPKLVYDNVPKGALLWLRNHTAGREEQVFYMENGKQVFLNEW